MEDLVICGEWDERFANSRRREWAASDGRCRGAHPEWGRQADNGLCAYCRWRLANKFDLFGVDELCLVASSRSCNLIVGLTFSLCLSFRYGVSVSELGCRGFEPSAERGGRGTTILTLRHPLPRSKPSPSNRYVRGFPSSPRSKVRLRLGLASVVGARPRRWIRAE